MICEKQGVFVGFFLVWNNMNSFVALNFTFSNKFFFLNVTVSVIFTFAP